MINAEGKAVRRVGDLDGLAGMIADLIEGNVNDHPERLRLLDGPVRRVSITAGDLDAHVGLTIGEGSVAVSAERPADAHLSITTDSETLLDLPRAKLLFGLPSLGDPLGRAVTKKMLSGKLKVRGIARVGLLSRVQRLLSVS